MDVRVDLQRPDYTSASQTLVAPALISTQAALDVRLHARHGNIRAVVRVSAPGLPEAPSGEVRIHADHRTPRTVVLTDGIAIARLTDFGPGVHVVKVAYQGAELVRGATARATVQVRN
jgi:hypothetical protein